MWQLVAQQDEATYLACCRCTMTKERLKRWDVLSNLAGRVCRNHLKVKHLITEKSSLFSSPSCFLLSSFTLHLSFPLVCRIPIPSLSFHLLDFASLCFLHSSISSSLFLLSSLFPFPPSGDHSPSCPSPFCLLSLSLSLLNHDCRPNCVMVFEGMTLQLRAIRDINPEEEVWTRKKNYSYFIFRTLSTWIVFY